MRPLEYYYAPDEWSKGVLRRLPSEQDARNRPHHFVMPPYSIIFHNGDLEAEEAHYMAIEQWCKDNLKHSVRKRRNWMIDYKRKRVEIRDDADAFAFRLRWC